MKEECLICKAPLEYLQEDIEMEANCVIRKKKAKQDVSMAITYAMNVICRGSTVLWGSV